MKLLQTIATTLAIVLLASTRTSADVRVAPASVFITDKVTAGKLFLDNSGSEPQEVELSLAFGYLASDANGSIRVVSDIYNNDTLRSSAKWLKIFPSKVRIPAHSQQTVRIIAYPPSSLPDGEYWSRIIISSRKATDIRTNGTNDIATQIDLVIQTLVPVMFRKGIVQTGVTLTDVKADRDSTGRLIVETSLQRSGNATFLGRLVVRLYDPDGKIIGEESNEVAVYYAITRRVAFPLTTPDKGEYTIDLLIDTDRTDLQPQSILPARPVTAKIPFDIE